MKKANNRGQRKNMKLLYGAGILILSYVVVVIAFYFMQDRLTFYPQPITEERIAQLRTHENVAEITMTTRDGKKIHGWLVEGNEASASPSPLLIYFGGNGEEVSHLIPQLKRNLSTHSVLLMNYRGYGLSEGKPSETAMFQDALLIFDSVKERKDIEQETISVMGRSMGTGVAVYLAKEREVDRVVLVSPYDSLLRVAQGRYPFLPVSFLLNHQFDNVGRAPTISYPLLTLVAEDDRIIPPSHSKNLVEAWKGPTSKLLYEGFGHNTVQNHPDYWKVIYDFLNE